MAANAKSETGNTTLLLVNMPGGKDKEKITRLYEEVPPSQLATEVGEDEDLKERDQWANRFEYMLSVIGYVVDLGNCVRFPYIAYKNGGGAFLIPYFTFLSLIGVPMMYMEMAISQFFQVGNIHLWKKVNPHMKGIGYGSLLVVIYITLYYTTIIAYATFYLFASFQDPLPWSTCDNPWNTQNCFSGIGLQQANTALLSNVTAQMANMSNSSSTAPIVRAGGKSVTPGDEYFNRFLLGIHESTGLHDLGPIKLDLSMCLALVYFIMYVLICNGVRGTGKAVYVTAILPYLILCVLLVHGLSLEGSAHGIKYFLVPDFSKLLDFGCWKDAAIQVFFTLGPGISVLTTYGSYSKRDNNCQINALAASGANVIASMLSGIVVFSSLGHLSYQVNQNIEDITSSDLGLSFIAYPDLLSSFKYAKIFSVIFFLMIINLGLDSNFGGLEAIYTALADEFHLVNKYRKVSMAFIHLILFVASLPTVTYGGNFLVTFLDTFATSPALMIIVMMEAISVAWFYNMDKFIVQNEEMFGVRANWFWRICWKFISPSIIFVLFVISIYYFEAPMHGDYVYPLPFVLFGWTINISVMLPIPLYAVYYHFFTGR